MRKWDVVRVASLFVLASFAAAGGLLAGSDVSTVGAIVAGVVVIVSSAGMWKWARDGIRRESALQYRTEYSMYCVERLLGLHVAMKDEDDRWLPDEPFVFPSKHREWQFSVGEAPAGRADLEWWVDRKVHAHGFVGDVDLLFGVFFLASSGIGIALILRGAGV